MPVPGPRTQFRPAPGYRNPAPPEGVGPQRPTRINSWLWPKPLKVPGRSPGTMVLDLRRCVLGVGQVRQYWRQSVNKIGAQDDYSWTENAPGPDRPVIYPGAVGITRALRYMTRSIYAGAGIDDTRLFGLHTIIEKHNRSKPVSIPAGAVRSRPTVRNRLTSFGSRVPPINPRVPAAQ